MEESKLQSPIDVSSVTSTDTSHLLIIQPNPKLVETELEIEENILLMFGNFLSVQLNESDDGEKRIRNFRNTHAEFKIPCEHSTPNSSCALEI